MLATAIFAVTSIVLGAMLAHRIMGAGTLAAPPGHRFSGGSVPATSGLVHPEDLKGLLLSPAELDDILHTQDLTVYQGGKSGLFIDTADPPDCAGLWAPGMGQVYASTRFIDAVTEELHGPVEYVKLTLQALVAYTNAADAGAVFQDITHKWDHCANTEVLVHRHEGGTIAVGDPKMLDGMLTVSWTKTGGTGWGCQRALKYRSNIVIDMRVCDFGGSNQAPELVDKVAARIPQ
jgi:PknH-like protein